MLQQSPCRTTVRTRCRRGFIKLLANGSGRLIGATVVAPGAAQMANELSVALANRVDLSKLARTMHVYPTMGLGVQQLASEFALKHATLGLRGRVARLLARGGRKG